MSVSALFRTQSSAVWYERLNLMNKFKKFCQWCTGKFEFWCLVGLCTLAEPVLCSKWPTGNVLLAQVALLGASTVFFIIQLIGVASREWEKIIMIEAMSSLQSLAIPKHMMDLSLLKIFIFFAAEGEYILEFFCLTIGWILIFWHPGLAALRCFRPFRLLWFYEVEVFRTSMEFYFNPIFGEVFVSRGFRVLKFAIKALSALGNEMFRLTADTKGGLLLMMIFFYSAFVLGTSLWIETDAKLHACTTAGTCMYTLMRLTFFDGTGFDFAYKLIDGHTILFFIVLMYMCITAFGILNGLVGIFGTAFARASDIAFEDEEDRMAQTATNNAIKAASRRDLYADGDDDEDADAPGGGGGKGGEGLNAQQQENKAKITGFIGGSRAMMSNLLHKNNGSAYTMAPGSAAAAPAAATTDKKPTPATPKTAKLSMKDLVALNRAKKSGTTVGIDITGGAGSGSEVEMAPIEERVKPAHEIHKKAAGMFGKQISAKSLVSNASAGANQASLQATTQLNALNSHVGILQKKLEKQTELMGNMFEHILFLQSQLTTAHPQLSSMERPRVIEHHSSSPSVAPDSPTPTPSHTSNLSPFKSSGGIDKAMARFRPAGGGGGSSSAASVAPVHAATSLAASSVKTDGGADEEVHPFNDKDQE